MEIESHESNKPPVGKIYTCPKCGMWFHGNIKIMANHLGNCNGQKKSQNESFYLIFYLQKEKKIEKLCIDKIENLKTTN